MILQTKVQRDFSQSTSLTIGIAFSRQMTGQLCVVVLPASDLPEPSLITPMQIALLIKFCLHSLRLQMLTSIASLLPGTT